MSTRELALADLLQVEDCPELLSSRCRRTGIPLWTVTRFPFIRTIMEDLLYKSPILQRPSPPRRWHAPASKLLKLAASAARNQTWLATRTVKYPVVVAATGARLLSLDGKYFNCLSDHFVGALPRQTASIENMFEWRWPFPRHHRNTLVQTPYLMAASFRGARAAEQYRSEAEALVDLAASRAKELLGWNLSASRRTWLVQNCAKDAASLQPLFDTYRMLFSRLGAQVVVKEEACYGGADNAAMMLAARDLGMTTAEYQHGLISAGHNAYNFAPSVLIDPAFTKIRPDYLLTYGSWWGEQINAPVSKVPVGNPHRSEVLANRRTPTVRKNVLVLGDGLDTALYLELCERLARAGGDAQDVVFRPHPLERAAIQARNLSEASALVRIDTRPDIYDSLADASAVISEVSTGLFEAIGLVPRIFVWDTPKARFAVPVHPFTRFSDATELLGLLADPAAGRVGESEAEAVWAPHWKDNFLRFMEGVVH